MEIFVYKICYLNDVRPDLAGIILVPNNDARCLFPYSKMRSQLDEKIPLVGVFLNQDADEILKYREIIQMVQLHGNESEREISKIQQAGLPVIKVMKPDHQYKTQAMCRMIDAGAGTGKLLIGKIFSH